MEGKHLIAILQNKPVRYSGSWKAFFAFAAWLELHLFPNLKNTRQNQSCQTEEDAYDMTDHKMLRIA